MKSQLPDVAYEQSRELIPLDEVGMGSILIHMAVNFGQENILIPVHLEITVSLNQAGARGIHMSRMYLLAQELLDGCELEKINWTQALEQIRNSQQGLSLETRVHLRFDLPLKRFSLISKLASTRLYKCSLSALHSEFGTEITKQIEVLYSSTCPASAALSRALIRENLMSEIKSRNLSAVQVAELVGTTAGMIATPHAQRSLARVSLILEKNLELGFEKFIDLIENSLGTPVQGAVKREDEQEFARLNGSNLMFCEDAARRIYRALDEQGWAKEFNVFVEHQESLHAHNAIARVRKHRKINE